MMERRIDMMARGLGTGCRDALKGDRDSPVPVPAMNEKRLNARAHPLCFPAFLRIELCFCAAGKIWPTFAAQHYHLMCAP